jgi:glycosyltransferase involved in cell wall biosynthesis
MRIGCFVDLFYPYLLGGVEQRCFEVAKRLVSFGDKVTVFSTSLTGIRSHEEMFGGKLRIIRTGPIRNPTTHRRRSSIIGYALSVLKYANVVKDYDILDFNQYCGLPGEFLTRFRKVPHVLTVHDLVRPRVTRPASLLVNEAMIRLHDEGPIVTVSSAVREKLVRFFKVDPERIAVIPNGVDNEAIRRASKKRPKADRKGPFRLCYVGRLVRYKNVDHAILALKHLNSEGYSVTLDVIGMGEEMQRLRELSRRLGVDRIVNFHGFIQEKSSVYEFMSEADLFVNPSVIEGFGITLIESMAAGTPVVAYDLPAYHDFIENGYNGLLVEPNSVQELSNTMKMVLDDSTLASKLVDNGVKVAQKYDIDEVVGRLRDVYLSEIQRRR